MATKNLAQILSGMAPHINGDTDVPTVGDEEYLLWQECVNQSEEDWADVDYNWPQLQRLVNTTMLLSGTSIALPGDFRKLDGYVSIGGNQYAEVKIEDIAHFEGESFVSIDYSGGYMTVSPALATTLPMSYRYHSRVTQLTTTTAVPLCPSNNFIIYSASAKVLFSREDGKYVEFENKADKVMQQMIGADVHEGVQMDTRVKSKQELSGFTLGVS